jgi:integrase
MGSIYLRGRVWWSQVYVNGVPVRESCRTRDRGEAKRVLAEREAQVAHGQLPVRGNTTWADAAEALLAYYRAYGTRNPREAAYRLKHLEQHFQGHRLVDIDSTAVTGYVVQRRAQGAAPATINVELATLRRGLKLAHEQGKLAALPVMRLLKPAAPRAGFLEQSEVEAICRRLPEDLQLVVRIGFTYGWRVSSEVLPLERRQVNLDAGTLRLDPGQTKNDDGRVVYLTPEVNRMLVAQLERVRTLERQMGRVIPWVFPHLGKRLQGERRRGFWKAWRRACILAGLPGKLKHDLRRSAVRHMVNVGINERVAMTITGHRTRTVFDRYHIISPNDLMDAARKLSDKTRKKRDRLKHSGAGGQRQKP